MHAITKLVPLILLAGMALAPQGCENVTVDTTGGLTPPAGVIRGTVNYIGPPPCSQGGHIVGNAVMLVFDARNPPPPGGLGVTAANFGVVSGDVLFHNWPVTQGAAKVCPAAGAAPLTVSAPYAISPMSPGRYLIQAFFDYTGDFFATFKFRQLPEATDIGGGYIDIDDAEKLVPNGNDPETLEDGGTTYPLMEQQADPNYAPIFLPVDIGTPGPIPATSLWDVPTFTMPQDGFLADNVSVTVAVDLTLARPYFYPAGVDPTTIAPAGTTPLSTITVYGASSAVRPTATVDTPQNPKGDVDFIPVLSFPQDLTIYATPSVTAIEQLAIGLTPIKALNALAEYQSALPELQLSAGMPLPEQNDAVDTISVTNPFHMQLGLPSPPVGAAPGGNGGIYVWWNGSHQDSLLDFIPEQPGVVYRMWPLVVLAKLSDLPAGGMQPNANDLQGLNAQGSDLLKPIVIIQGITLNGDTLLGTTSQGPVIVKTDTKPLAFPDPSNLQNYVTALLRPSTLCLDPRAPDHGGIVVTPGTINSSGNVVGPFPPTDTAEPGGKTGTVIASANVSNPQLTQLVNHKAAGSTNGLVGGCLPTGRYQVNLVYPTGQAWTTPNETGSCAAAEGNQLFPAGAPDPGSCSAQPRPTLYSQGTRAVVEITPTTNPANCIAGSALPPVPFACTSLCSDPSLDPTTATPCTQCLDTAYIPGNTTPPCTTPAPAAAVAKHH